MPVSNLCLEIYMVGEALPVFNLQMQSRTDASLVPRSPKNITCSPRDHRQWVMLPKTNHLISQSFWQHLYPKER